MTGPSLSKELILDTAEQVLCRFGSDKATVVDVAKALKISHAAVYRYFPNKAALLSALVERWLHNIADSMQLVLRTPGSASERLRLWFETLLNLKRAKLLEQPELFALYFSLSEQTPQVVAAYTDSLLTQITQLIDNGISAQEFRPCSSQRIAIAVLHAMLRFRHPAHAQSWTSSTLQQEFDDVWQLILSGIANTSNTQQSI